MKITFLTPNQALKEYEKSNYFAEMSPVEIAKRLTRMNAGNMIQGYRKYLKPFSNLEVDNVKKAMKITHSKIMKFSPELIPEKIKLIRLSSGIDWDSPYTINNCIVIPERILNNIPLDTLCHEFIHIIQRYPLKYPINVRFEKIYANWNFVKLYDRLDFSACKQDFFPIMTNPDGLNFQWLWIYNNKSYLLMFGEKGTKIIGGITEVIGNRVSSKWMYIHEAKFYTQFFPSTHHQLYHPNEILAEDWCKKIMN
jgi:hypothetical protein